MIDLDDCRPAVIGLGYVGLPLAVELGKRYPTTGFDIKAERIAELASGRDSTLEVEPKELEQTVGLNFTCDAEDLKACNVFIVTVPTPIDRHKQPDLKPLILASEMVGGALKKGDIVIYESTVYPGATEEVCVPILEKESGLRLNQGFYVGYSPERINPGDSECLINRNTRRRSKIQSLSGPKRPNWCPGSRNRKIFSVPTNTVFTDGMPMVK